MDLPAIGPIPSDPPRPLWSVMIPTYNCAAYLRQTLESVLAQDPGPEQMQIEVVDDCSTGDNPETVVLEAGKGRVAFHRKPQNEGATRNFNTCIERARGRLVHILHGDDFVLPGFYQRIETLAETHPEVALLATRSWIMDETHQTKNLTRRLPALETGARVVDDFFYENPLQTPAVVIRRNFYEQHGGFRVSLLHTADCEMWARAIDLGGGIVTEDALACYRMFAANDTSRLARTAENLRDIERLNQLFAARHPAFDPQIASRQLLRLAYKQLDNFSKKGDVAATEANQQFWKTRAPLPLRLRKMVAAKLRRLFGESR
jgi:glycosyltransferase involved in cell wall biosynthesis